MGVINADALTLNAREAETVSEVIFERVFNDSDLAEYHEIETGIDVKTQIAFAERLGLLGKVTQGCTPNEAGGFALTEKFWTPVMEDFRLRHCQTDMPALLKLFRKSQRVNPDFFDVVGTQEFGVIISAVETSMIENIHRKVWFNDSLAKTVANGGVFTNESGKLYIAVNTNLVYRWGGSAYVVTSSSLALGETSVTAYRGDRGKTAYDHSQLITGNPHGTTIADISGLQTAINAKLTGTIATDAETQLSSTLTEDNKFVSRLKLFNWWTWIKTQAATIAGSWNFIGTLKKSGVDVATATDLATKLNTTTNTGLAGTGIRIPKVSENGTITVDAFLSWATETNQLIVGSSTSPGKINVNSPIFELAVQDTISSGQSRILFNSAQEDALSLVDKTGTVYMTFKSATDGKAIVLKQREIFDEQLFYPLSRRQAALTSAGAGVTVYGKDSLGNTITIPFVVEGTVLFTEAVLVVKNSNATQVIAAKIKAVAKRVGGVTTITTAPLEIISNNSSYPGFTAGIEAVGDNLQFYFTPSISDTTTYTGAFTEIKYTIN